MLVDRIKPRGKFMLEHIRNGQCIGKYEIQNLITNVGLDAFLDIMFHATTQITTWYIGLIDNSGFTAVDEADTISSHSGWSEFTTYSDATRMAWTEAAASGQSITSSAVTTFAINGSGTVKGLFLVSNSTKGGTTGTLWCATTFATAIPVVNTDSFKVTYTVNLG